MKSKQNKNIALSKLPPQANDVESAVLGAMMLERESVDVALELLGNQQPFYLKAHQIIFSEIKNLFQNSQPIDMLTVVDGLKTSGELETVGGTAFVVDLTTRVNSASNIEAHLRIVIENHIKRTIIKSASKLINDGYDSTIDSFVALDSAFTTIDNLSNGLENKTIVKIGDVLWDSIKHTEAAAKSKNNLTGVPSGYAQLDKITGGWQDGHMIVVAGRPSMGKTALALNFARNSANEFSSPVAVFSLEMTTIEVVQRIQSAATDIPLRKLSRGEGIEEEDWEGVINQSSIALSDSPIFIDDSEAINILQLRIKVKRAVKNHGVKLIIIDYMQLMNGEGTNREQEISKISRGIKALAKEVDKPIIILSQLSRAVETRGGDHRPKLSDLRESGSIEQDADLVIFPYRPEYYGIEQDASGNDLRGQAEIIISKNRGGDLGSAFLIWKNYIQKFSENANIS